MAYKQFMPHTRKADQRVDAFSAPIDLLNAARARAATLGMTKSGYFRYALAKELGYSDVEARLIGQHGAVTESVRKNARIAGHQQRINTKETLPGVDKEVADAARASAPIALAKALREGRERQQKQKAASTTGSKPEPTSVAARDPETPPESPTQAPKK